MVIGSYTVVPVAGAAGAKGQAMGRIMIQAKVLSMDSLRLSGLIEDSAELNRLFDAENAVAWKVAGAMDPHSLGVGANVSCGAGRRVPLPAFEDYIRGINAPERGRAVEAAEECRARRFPTIRRALLELGKEQYAQRDFDGAAAYVGEGAQDRPARAGGEFLPGAGRV